MAKKHAVNQVNASLQCLSIAVKYAPSNKNESLTFIKISKDLAFEVIFKVFLLKKKQKRLIFRKSPV